MRNFSIVILLFISGAIMLVPSAIAYVFSFIGDRQGVAARWCAKAWSWLLLYPNIGWKIKIEGTQNIEQGKSYVIIANHCTMLDILMIYLLPINNRFVSKREVLYLPIIGWAMALQRNIIIRRGDAASAKDMIAKGDKMLKNGVSVAIFPEGTRSKTGQVGKFHAGAFLLASKADVDVLPIMLHGSFDALHYGRLKQELRIEVLPPVSLKGAKTSQIANKLNEQYKEVFNG